MRETCGEPVHNRRLIRASGVIDAAGVAAAPAVLLIEGGQLVAVGEPAAIGSVQDAVIEDYPDTLILPGLVNVHAHLDLSGSGIWPPAGADFRGWVGQVRRLRAESTLESAMEAVERGIALSLAGGTTCIGDIAGHPPSPAGRNAGHPSIRAGNVGHTPIRADLANIGHPSSRAEAAADAGGEAANSEAAHIEAAHIEAANCGHPPNPSLDALRASPLRGTSFLECFGIGSRQVAAIERLRALLAAWPPEQDGVRLGVSPHAPYSCGPDLFAAAAASGLPVMTHLAETPGEVELLLRGTGPLREMLEHDIGVWDASTPTAGEHPVDFAIGPLARCRGIATHLNWIEPRHVELLGKAGVRVAHCPRASAAFGHAPPTLPTHPWRSLRDAGLIVGLGTDSLLCLDTPDRISVLDEMRLLATRDGVDPMTLLAMATIDGARVLDLDPSVASIGPAVAGLIACPAAGSDPYSMLQDVLSRREAPRWLLPPSARLGSRTVANT